MITDVDLLRLSDAAARFTDKWPPQLSRISTDSGARLIARIQVLRIVPKKFGLKPTPQPA